MRARLPMGKPGGTTLPGFPLFEESLAAFFCNDNHAIRQECPQGAAGLLLGLEIDAGGEKCLTIRVLLAQDDARPLLHRAGQSDDIIALWRAVGRKFNMPLYVADRTGACVSVSPEPGTGAYRRRGGSALARRRPRFLARRTMPLDPAP